MKRRWIDVFCQRLQLSPVRGREEQIEIVCIVGLGLGYSLRAAFSAEHLTFHCTSHQSTWNADRDEDSMLISTLWSYPAFPKSKSSSVLLAPSHLEPTPDLMTLDGEYHRLSYSKMYPVLGIYIAPRLALALSFSNARANCSVVDPRR